MKTLYEAEDGTIFSNEDACYNYETTLKFPELFNIQFYDEKNNVYHIEKTDPFNDKYYQNCEKISIRDNAELMCLHWLAFETGWSEFEQITEPGTWIRIEKVWSGHWERID